MKESQDRKFKGIGIFVVAVIGGLGITWWQISATSAQAQSSTTPVKVTSVAVTQTATSSEPAAPASTTVTTETTTAPSAPVSETVPATTTATETATPSTIVTDTPSAPATETTTETLAPATPVPGSGTAILPATPESENALESGQTQQPVTATQAEVGGVGVTNYYAPVVEAVGSSQSRLPVIFSLDFQTIWDDNIFITSSDKKADVIYRTIPSVVFESTRLEKGDRQPTESKRETTEVAAQETLAPEDQPEHYFRAGYAAIWQKYNKYFANDSLDHNAQIFYRFNGDRTILEAGQTFTTFNGPNVDVQGTLQQTTYGTRLFGSYAVTGKTTLELEAVQSLNRYDVGFNTDEWAISPYINYEIAPKLTLGLGSIVGILHVSDGVNQTYQQPNVRAVYQYSEKLNFTARAGWEIRQFGGYDWERTTPMFAVGSTWLPFDGTTLQVEGYRRTLPSIGVANEDYDATGVALTIKQRFMQKFYAAFRGAYERSEYFFTNNGESSSRDQDYFTLRPMVGYTPNDMLTFNIYYQFAENISTQADGGFRDNQVGFQGSFSY